MEFVPVCELDGDRLTVKLTSQTPFELDQKWQDKGYRVYVQVNCKGLKVYAVSDPVVTLYAGETESTSIEYEIKEQCIGTWRASVNFINQGGVSFLSHKFMVTVQDLENPVLNPPEVVFVTELVKGWHSPGRDEVNLTRLRSVVADPSVGGFTDPAEIDILTRYLARIEGCLQSGKPDTFDVQTEGVYAFHSLNLERLLQFDVADGTIYNLVGQVKFIDAAL